MEWQMEYIENLAEEKKQLKAIFNDMFKYAPSKICGTIGNAIIVPVYTSLLSPNEYGLYSLSIAVLSFLCIIFQTTPTYSGYAKIFNHSIVNAFSKFIINVWIILHF